MKKLIVLLLALAMLFALAACGGQTETKDPTPAPATDAPSAAPVQTAAPTAEPTPVPSAEPSQTPTASSSSDLPRETPPASGSNLPRETAPASNSNLGTEPIRAELTVRDYGVITLELYPDVAPITVANFVKLARSGFYDGLTFHRIMDGFMIQGGDPNGNGTGGSGETIKGEFSANGVTNELHHTEGVISMARPGRDMDGASSQFFITVADCTASLDGQYAAFGRVIEGYEIVQQIAKDARPVDSNGTIPAAQQPMIESIVILG